MERREFVQKLAHTSLAAGLASSLGCGTLMYRERIGQQHSRDIDWQVAALNGLGLAFFFVPGAVAFAVDFYTGAIYLPPEYPQPYAPEVQPEMIGGQYPPQQNVPPQGGYTPTVQPASFPQPTDQIPHEGAAPHSAQPLWNQSGRVDRTTNSSLTLRRITPKALSPSAIEDALLDATGQRIVLMQPSTRVSRMSGLYQFSDQLARHKNDARFGRTVDEAFVQS